MWGWEDPCFSRNIDNPDPKSPYPTSTFPIMHLICPPKFCLTFVFHFSWVLQPSQDKLKTMLMQNLGGQIRCILGNVEMANERVHYAALSDQISWAHAMMRGRDERPISPFRIWRFYGESVSCSSSSLQEKFVSWDCVKFLCFALCRKATPNNKQQNRIKWPWIEHRLHRKCSNKPEFT